MARSLYRWGRPGMGGSALARINARTGLSGNVTLGGGVRPAMHGMHGSGPPRSSLSGVTSRPRMPRISRAALGDYNACISACDPTQTNYAACTAACVSAYPQGEVAGSTATPTTSTTTATTTTSGGGVSMTTLAIVGIGLYFLLR